MVFIAHEQTDSKTEFITPKGDKRCIAPIVDKCDYVVYIKSNGVDKDNNVIKSSAYLAETDKFFARSRIDYTPTYIQEFTFENLQAAIQQGIDTKAEKENAVVVSNTEQFEQNKVEALNYDELMNEFNEMIKILSQREDFNSYWKTRITQITENYLGKGGKVSQCTPNQVEAISLINNDLKEAMENK